MDVVKAGLDGSGGGVLDEDIRIAMIRWKMERAVGAAFTPYDVYRVMSAHDAAERINRQRLHDAGEAAAGQAGEGAEEERKEGDGSGKVTEEKENTDSGVTAPPKVVEGDAMHDEEVLESKEQPPLTKSAPQHKEDNGSAKEKSKSKDKGKDTGEKFAFTMPPNGAAEPPYPPALTASEMMFQLSMGGGTSQRCLIGRFQREWSEIEPVVNKLVAEQLAWKRGLLYCPS